MLQQSPSSMYAAASTPAEPAGARVALRVARFEACSAFTRVAARIVAEPPKAARMCFRVNAPARPVAC